LESNTIFLRALLDGEADNEQKFGFCCCDDIAPKINLLINLI
jgi:hypothetical protein